MLARALVIAFVGLLGTAVPLYAQDPPPEFELPDVVSPGRRPQRAAASPASVTVLTAADLRRLGARTVGDALAVVPETVARAYGGPGSLITPSIRGSSAEQVLVLLDGVALNGVFGGTVDLSTIPIDDVERIEVLRGPFSAIYGSGAMGGVISIVTRRAARPSFAIGGGSLGAAGLSVTAGGAARFTLRYDGAAGERPNGDLRSGSLSLRLGGGDGGRIWDLALFGAAAARGVPGSLLFPTPFARQDDRRIAAALTVTRAGEAVADRLRVGVHYDGVDFRDPTFGINDRHTGTAWSAEWQRVLRAGSEHVTTFGLDTHVQTLNSTTVGARSAVVGAAYVQDDRALTARLLLSAGLRVDWHSIWGLQANPRLGLVYFVRPDLRLRFAIGKTFRGPTLADLYYPFDGFVVGNPLLRPEQAWAFDAAVEAVVRPALVARATVFWSDVRDLIIYVPDASFVFSPRNIGAAAIRGASAELEGALSRAWTLRVGVTWMRATDGASGADLPNRPRFTGAAALTRSLGRDAALTVSVIGIGERFADVAGMIRLPAYLTTALTLQVPVGTGTDLRVTVQNLFDARYEPLQGYPAPGRTVFGELVLRR